MKKRLLYIAAILLVATLATLGTLKVSNVMAPTDNSYGYNGVLGLFSYDPGNSKNTGVLCNGSNFDTMVQTGWPLHFEITDNTAPGCGGDAAYPIIFVCDVLIFATALSLVFIGAIKVKKRLQ